MVEVNAEHTLTPVVTAVMARNKIIEMAAMEPDAVFTRELSWRSVSMLRPRQYTRGTLCKRLTRNPESA